MTEASAANALPYWQLSYEERMERRRQRRANDPEFQARKAARLCGLREAHDKRRWREIWKAIGDYDRQHAAGTHRIRGIGAAAKRAGY